MATKSTEAIPMKVTASVPQYDAVSMSMPTLQGMPSVGLVGPRLHFGEWQAPLLGCCENMVPSCLLPWLLPCVAMAQIAHRMHIASYGVVLLTIWTAVILDLCLMVLASPQGHHVLHDPNHDEVDVQVSPLFTLSLHFAADIVLAMMVFVWHVRSKIRRRFEIPGSVLGDAAAAIACLPCALTQMATQVHCYERGHCDFGPPDVLAPYAQ